MFAVGITPAIKHSALDLKFITQRGHTLPVQYPSRYRNPKFHPENSGTCHPNLRSLQCVSIFSVSIWGPHQYGVTWSSVAWSSWVFMGTSIMFSGEVGADRRAESHHQLRLVAARLAPFLDMAGLIGG
jgi:hypothetical protein